MKNRVAFLVLSTLCVSAAFAGVSDLILSNRLFFAEAPVKSGLPVTLVLTPEFLAITREHKIVLHRYDLRIGEAIGANLRRALEANYKNVIVVASPGAVKTKFSIEPKFYSFETKLPGTVFGAYTAKLKVGFLIRGAGASGEREHVEDVIGTDKRSATHVLFLDSDYNSNDKRLGIASNGAIQSALEGLILAIK